MNGHLTAKADPLGLTVQLNLEAVLPQVLDMLADAYGDAPAAVGQLLMDLSVRRQQLADAQQGVETRDTPDCVVDHAAAAADPAREALCEAVSTEYLTVDLSYSEALSLSSTVLAAAMLTGAGRRERRAA